jgi:hypothetical protein
MCSVARPWNAAPPEFCRLTSSAIAWAAPLIGSCVLFSEDGHLRRPVPSGLSVIFPQPSVAVSVM